jgi:hypothetical protein
MAFLTAILVTALYTLVPAGRCASGASWSSPGWSA